MKYRSTASVRFSKCLNLAMYGIFYIPSTSASLRVLFCGFSSKTLSIFSISHKLGFPECGKSLVFSSPVLKCWNSRATRSLTTSSPSTVSFVCVLSYVVSGGGPDIVRYAHSGRPARVYLSSVLVHSMLIPLQASDP